MFKASDPNYGGSSGSGLLTVLIPLRAVRAVLVCIWVLAYF